MFLVVNLNWSEGCSIKFSSVTFKMSLCNKLFFPIVPKKHPAYFLKVSLSIVSLVWIVSCPPNFVYPLWLLLMWICLFSLDSSLGLVQIQKAKFLIQYYLEQQEQITEPVASLLSRALFDRAVHVPLKPALCLTDSLLLYFPSREWHCHLPNFPGYRSQLFLSLSLTPNKSPSLESSHLNTPRIGPHLLSLLPVS